MRRVGWYFPGLEPRIIWSFFVMRAMIQRKVAGWWLADDSRNFELKKQRLVKHCPVPPGGQRGEIL